MYSNPSSPLMPTLLPSVGFTITMYEYRSTIETLWQTTKGTWFLIILPLDSTKRNWEPDFLKSHPEHLVEGNAMGFISDNGGEEYNLCHCESFTRVQSVTTRTDTSHFIVWSNFEIADMDFWRAPAYTAYVDYLEASGGFYYEVCIRPLTLLSDTSLITIRQRWGDAPVHSIGAALFAHKDQIHFFDEIGYEHAPYQHCPREKKSWENGRCGCNPSRSFGGSPNILTTING